MPVDQRKCIVTRSTRSPQSVVSAVMLFVLWCAASASATAQVALPCIEGDLACIVKAWKASPVLSRSYWSSMLARPLAERVGPPSDELLVYLNLDNMGNPSFANRPRQTSVTPELRADFDRAFASLPPRVRKLLGPKLAGIFFVEDLGGTALTTTSFGGRFRADVAFIVLDMQVLAKYTANSWATWKENTPFRADANVKLDAIIEHADQDTRANAIRYILLHEIGHVLAIGESFHPPWGNPMPTTNQVQTKYPFTWLSWRPQRESGRWVGAEDNVFDLRPKVAYYRTPQLGLADATSAYTMLANTPFPTLYAATNPFDDFAESFVSYVHTEIDKRPWEIRLSRNGKLEVSVKSCWAEQRCAAKREMLRVWLGQ